jgi:hypothetical protein
MRLIGKKVALPDRVIRRKAKDRLDHICPGGLLLFAFSVFQCYAVAKPGLPYLPKMLI